jgi:hypothetical protein
MRTGVPSGLIVGVALLGCTSAITTLVKAPSKPAGCTIQVFPNDAAVTRPHEAVCRINTTLMTPFPETPTDANIPGDTQGAACACGGDAIVLPAPDAGTSPMVTVIRYTGS